MKHISLRWRPLINAQSVKNLQHMTIVKAASFFAWWLNSKKKMRMTRDKLNGNTQIISLDPENANIVPKSKVNSIIFTTFI